MDAATAECLRPALLAACVLIAAIAEVAFAALGFGPAVLFEISWELCALLGISSGDIETAVGDIVVVELASGLVQFAYLRRHFRWNLAILFNVPLALTLPLGTLGLERFGRDPLLKRLLGLVFLLIIAIQVTQRRRAFAAAAAAAAAAAEGGCEDGQRSRSPAAAAPELSRPLEPLDRRGVLAVIVAEAFSGLSRGLFGVAGPPVMVLLMFYSLDRDVWRCVATTNRLVQVTVQGAVLGLHADFTPRCWPLYLALASGGLAGLALGNTLAPLVDAVTFRSWLMLFLSGGALLMITSGNRTLSAVAGCLTVGVIAVAVSALALPAAARSWRQRRRRGQQDVADAELEQANHRQLLQQDLRQQQHQLAERADVGAVDPLTAVAPGK